MAILGCLAAGALAWPAASRADHVSITATGSARLAERSGPSSWIVEVTWSVTCAGAAAGKENYSGNLNLVDLDTGERIYLGGVSSGSGTARQLVGARERERHLTP